MNMDLFMSNKSKIIPLLKNISSRLWEGHAAVLVGAGFSRNAQPLSSSSRKFPMWNDLGDLFYEKVYCEKNTNKYSNVLKLGDEVQAAFGRATLDKLILENVPDKEYEPSKLHSSLLSLPWVDVFTTNYDSLLERACVSVDSRKYDFVFNKNDLMNAERPRIIKLHGSFPSERPFIVTEEDYRRYPIDNSPFVNTVQQSLIENTLCLIGFSGDDPNFLNWTGWIRDNIGVDNSPKIFMVGLFSFNEAQRKLLEKRNIVIVDLSLLDDFDDNHYEAHKCFIDFLIESKGYENKFDWPVNDDIETISHNDSEETITNKIKKCITTWAQTQNNHPQWLITPEENRRKLWRNTNNWQSVCSIEHAWEGNTDLLFGFELLWRIDKCLLPIFDDVADFLFKITEKYKEELFTQKNSRKTNEVNEKLPFIIIGLLKYCRQESLGTKWNDLSLILSKHIKNLTPEMRSEYEYENILQSYFLLNFEEARAKISNWEINKQLPYYEVKRACLLAEFGMLEEAIKILEESLSIIRRNSFQSSKDNDYSSASQEAYIIFILKMFKLSWSLPDDGKDLSKKYRSRLAYLSQYRCDPDNEFKYLEIRLESSLKYDQTEFSSDFDLGKRTKTIIIGSTADTSVMNSFNLLLLAEKIGLPFHITDCTILGKPAVSAAKNIYNHCPQWSIFTALRVFNDKHFEYVLSRNNLSMMGRVNIDSQFDKYYQKYENLVFRQIDNKLENSSALETSMLKVVPEMLSRLVTKVSFEKKEKIISLLCRLYNSPAFTSYHTTKKLLIRTIENLSIKQKLSLIPLFIDFPSQPTNENVRNFERYGFINPFELLINLSNEKNKHLSNEINTKKTPSTKIKKNIIEIKNGDDKVRTVSSTKLITLYKLGLLNKSDETNLIKALWLKRNEYGFPKNSGYYNFFFIEDLKPDSENVNEKILHLIKQFSFPKQDGNSISITGGHLHYCNELVGSLSHMSFSDKDIELIISKTIEWFYLDKHWLQKKDDIRDEFLKRFDNIVSIITIILKKHNHLIKENTREEIYTLFLDMKSDGIQIGRGLTTLSVINNISLNEINSNIKRQFYHTDKDHVIDAIKSMYILLHKDIDISQILIFLGQKISWNHEPCVQESLSITLEILKHRKISLSSDFIEDILTGLHNIIEANKHYKISGTSLLNYLEKKVEVAKLASYLYNQYIDYELEIPIILTQWKEACTSYDEFEEVRNAWLYE